MGSKKVRVIALLVVLVFEGYYWEKGHSTSVTYDHKALVIDGKRRILQLGSIHYPRSTPEMWSDIIKKSKEGKLDVIETNVFWNYHEPVKGEDENLFASQGRPIILAQVENEYGNVEGSYGVGGQLYVKWAAEIAVNLNMTIPWVMCTQHDAPDPIAHIYSKTSNDCAAFLANYDSSLDGNVTFNGNSYFLPAWSVSILPDCKNVIFDTAKVVAQRNLQVISSAHASSVNELLRAP